MIAEAKIGQVQRDRMFMDKLQASQTARLMYMQGRVAENPIQPDACMAFAWDDDDHQQPVREEDMDELLETLDKNLDSWGGMTRGG